ncbi:MAG: hypothetical protein JXL97_12250 [Bacteroidales bacterium]|nr:hypothetical protein [Bacteroidales bacterium]
MITKETTIEELVENLTGAVKYLMEQGIRCIICGEPIWGTLEEAAKEKGFNDEQIAVFVADLIEIQKNPPAEDVKFEKRFDIKKL